MRGAYSVRFNTWKFAPILLVLVLSLFLRAKGLGFFPYPNQTADEYHYLWTGLSLWNSGRSTTWSDLLAYDHHEAVIGLIHYYGVPYRIVSPSLDHPPLFSLLLGGFTYVIGTQGVRLPVTMDSGHAIWNVDLGKVRIFSLVLYTLAFLILFDLVRQIGSFSTTFLSLVFYGFIGHIAIQGRLLVTENLSIIFFLLNLTIFQRYHDGKCSRVKFGLATIVLVTAAIITKLIGLSHAAAIVGLLLIYGKPRDIIYPVIGVFTGLGLFFLYGWMVSWELFWDLLKEHSRRFKGFLSVSFILSLQQIVHTRFFNFTLIIAWVALFIQLAGRHGPRML